MKLVSEGDSNTTDPKDEKDRSHKRVGPQEKTWLGNLKASDLEKQVSSRSWLVHQLHLEF